MARPTPVRDSARNLSLLWRVTLASAAVLGLAFVLLLFTPVTVHAPIRVTEALVLTVGLAVMLAANLFFVRRALAPLRDLEAQMDQIDLRNPELRLGRKLCSQCGAGHLHQRLQRDARSARRGAASGKPRRAHGPGARAPAYCARPARRGRPDSDRDCPRDRARGHRRPAGRTRAHGATRRPTPFEPR